MSQDDNDKNIGVVGRQEVLTALIIGVLALIPIAAIITLILAFQHPDIMQNLTVEGSIDIGKFVDKMVESYDAFLLMLGVGIGVGATTGAIKLGREFCHDGAVGSS